MWVECPAVGEPSLFITSKVKAQAERWRTHNSIPEPQLPTWPKPPLPKPRRLGWTVVPALVSSGLRFSAAWSWCCADPCKPIHVITGMPIIGQGGCVHLPMQDLVAPPWTLSKSLSWLVPHRTGKHSPNMSQETHQGAGVLHHPPGE